MADQFVDATYRGLEVGRRLRLRDIAADGAYLEAPYPMPVGTTLAIAADGGTTLDVVVVAVHEQTGAAADPPGMKVRLLNATQEAAAWWTERAGATPLVDDGRRTTVMPAVSMEMMAVAVNAALEADEGEGDGDGDGHGNGDEEPTAAGSGSLEAAQGSGDRPKGKHFRRKRRRS